MVAVVEGSKLFINGFIQQEVDIELDILCGKRKNSLISITNICPSALAPLFSKHSERDAGNEWARTPTRATGWKIKFNKRSRVDVLSWTLSPQEEQRGFLPEPGFTARMELKSTEGAIKAFLRITHSRLLKTAGQ